MAAWSSLEFVETGPQATQLLLQPSPMTRAWSTKRNYWLTPLHWAASGNCPETVEFLIKNGANISAKTVADETPLQLAIKYKRIEAGKVLKLNGAK